MTCTSHPRAAHRAVHCNDAGPAAGVRVATARAGVFTAVSAALAVTGQHPVSGHPAPRPSLGAPTPVGFLLAIPAVRTPRVPRSVVAPTLREIAVFRTTRARAVRRFGTVTAAVLAVAVAAAGPASAHVEVEAEDARALAKDVTLRFTAESESASAGITKLEVILPEGLVPGDITYDEGPEGWKLAPTKRGYTVSGPEIAAGGDAAYAVTVRQLPDAEELPFKTLQTYSDGRVDRWIELGESSGGGHGSSAPVLRLRAAEPGAKPESPAPTGEATTAAPAGTAPGEAGEPTPTPTPPPSDAVVSKGEDDGMSPAIPIGIGAVVIVVLGGAVWWLRRRRGAGSA
ncbi:DUF1775 domain-containing protein [Streptomyces sp. GC420]|uniref:DUF1775 domain-containing protein n=1 Tax=Streptomyces sp. GC420 TaxID=2697568 RepID=UPI001AA0D91E|nr:DUF1775 domain-containing protein [Streptomyces sp. GC420]NBM14512.1 DUF1775 domain-containing protein [Streptomyces sp. GC420]